MSALFYDHLIRFERLSDELAVYKEDHQKDVSEIRVLIDEVVEHRVVEVILDHLPQEQHEVFVVKLDENSSDRQILEWVKLHVVDIEEKIREEMKILEEEFMAGLISANTD